MKLHVYAVLASLVQAVKNCQQSSNAEWEGAHKTNAEQVVKNFLPRGSGWDAGTTLDWYTSRPDRLVLRGGFHHMNDGGFYNGWSEHDIIVTPSLTNTFDLRITGRDRNQIKEYLHELFDRTLRQIIEPVADERGPKGFMYRLVPSCTAAAPLEQIEAASSPALGALLKRIADALGTGEEGDGLVHVARNAHTAESKMAGIEHTAISGLDGDAHAALEDILDQLRGGAVSVTPAPDEHVAAARAVQQRTEAVVLHGYIDNLRKAIQMHPKHVSDDDSLLAAQDVVHTARMVLERIHDDTLDCPKVQITLQANGLYSVYTDAGRESMADEVLLSRDLSGGEITAWFNIKSLPGVGEVKHG